MPSLLHDSENEQYVKIVWETFDSLRGRRLKGKGKGVLGARETRGVREEGGKETPARRPLFFAFLTSTRQMLKS